MNIILFHPEESAADGTIRLSGRRAQHIRSVLRAVPGQSLRAGILDGPKGRARVLEVSAEAVRLQFEPDGETPPRPPTDLLLAMPRPKVMKRLWAQLSALGAGQIVLTRAEKTERYYFDSHVLDPGFYNPLLIEGLQQAGDTRMPKVRIVRRLKPFLEDELDSLFPGPGLRLLADPSGSPVNSFLLNGMNAARRRILLAVGPEGGWSSFERDLFQKKGFERVGMGPRILRTDTACVALFSQIALHSA